MNAAETIQAAIDKLEALRDNSGAWDWRRRHQHGEYGESIGSWENLHGYYDNPDEVVNTKTVAQNILPEDAELIVTLHRTIDAQLAILRGYIGTAEYWDKVRGTPADLMAVLDLAGAILGEAANA